MKVFLSYPSVLHPIVENIYRHLPQGAFETWLDTERISVGASLSHELARNIRDSEWFISFLNAEALQSDWIRQELDEAIDRERALGRPFIIPILLHDLPKEGLPDFLQQRRFLSYRGTNYPRQVAAFANELSDELLRVVCERPSLRCEGMAAVYFFSFVDQFVKKLHTANNLCLKWESGERKLGNWKQMELRILLPEFLDEFHLNELLRRPNLGQGVLLDGKETIFRQIGFDRAIENESQTNVTFYDVPNILNSAAKLFAQERGNPDWKKLNRMELLAFKYNVERLADKNITKTQLRAAVRVDLITDVPA
jgi:hypothetical protein